MLYEDCKREEIKLRVADRRYKFAHGIITSIYAVEYLSGNMGNDNVESARKLPAQVPEGNIIPCTRRGYCTSTA